MPVKFEEVKGDIFDTKCACIVNPVNSLGVMDEGLAKLFSDKFPSQCLHFNDESRRFSRLSFGPNKQLIKPMYYRNTSWKSSHSVLMFPTKVFPQNPSTLQYIKTSSQWSSKLLDAAYETSIAIPYVGCGLGMLKWDDVKPILVEHLSQSKILQIVHFVSL